MANNRHPVCCWSLGKEILFVELGTSELINYHCCELPNHYLCPVVDILEYWLVICRIASSSILYWALISAFLSSSPKPVILIAFAVPSHIDELAGVQGVGGRNAPVLA